MMSRKVTRRKLLLLMLSVSTLTVGMQDRYEASDIKEHESIEKVTSSEKTTKLPMVRVERGRKEKVVITSEYLKTHPDKYYMIEVLKDNEWYPVGVETRVKKQAQFKPYLFTAEDDSITMPEIFWNQLNEIEKEGFRLIGFSKELVEEFDLIRVSGYASLINGDVFVPDNDIYIKEHTSNIDYMVFDKEANSVSYIDLTELEKDKNIVLKHKVQPETKAVDDMFSNGNSTDEDKKPSDNGSSNNDGNNNQTDQGTEKYRLEADTVRAVYAQYSAAPDEEGLKKWVDNVRLVGKDGQLVEMVDNYKVTLIDPTTVDTTILGTTEYEIEVSTEDGKYSVTKPVLVTISDEEDEDGKGKGEGNTPPPTTPTTPPPTTPTTPTTPSPTTTTTPTTSYSSTSPSSATTDTSKSGTFPQLNDKKGSWSLITLGSVFIISAFIFIKRYFGKHA